MKSRAFPVTFFAASAGAFFALASTGHLNAQTTTPIAVTNPSFESPAGADGVTSVGLPGWLVVGNLLSGFPLNAPLNETVLTQNPTNTQYVGTTGANSIGTMDGSQIASFRTGVLNLVGGSASQIIPTGLLTLGTQYSLTVGVGNPLDSVFQGYTISILAGSTSLASITNAGVDVPDGTFQDRTLNFTLNNLAPIVTAGGLTINLSVPNGLTLGTGYGTDFDNVRLTAINVIPEPSTYASVAFGLLGLVGAQYARRRRGSWARA